MRFSASQKHQLYIELAKLLRAGFSIDSAAETILQQRTPAVQARYLEGLRRGLAERLSIADAVRATPVDLTPLEIAIVEAGEKGGRLEEAYDHLASYFAMLRQAQSRIRASLIYPVILLHCGVILPAIPKAILAGDPAQAVKSILVTLAALYIAAGGLIVIGKWLSRAARVNVAADRFLRVLPLLGKARRALALGRFCKVFHIHLLAAMPISQSLRAAGAASQSGVLDNGCDQMAEEIERGSSLAEAVKSAGIFPQELAGSLSTAEASGTLDIDLERWSRVYHETSVESLDAASGWFPKVLYVLVVLYVAWRILSMMSGYFDAIGGFLDE